MEDTKESVSSVILGQGMGREGSLLDSQSLECNKQTFVQERKTHMT